MTNNIEVLRGLLREAVPYLRDAGEPFEDDGGNEPLELSRRIEDALESDAALAAMGGQVCGEDWKARAIAAEADIERMTDAFNRENGPTFMGEPVLPPGKMVELELGVKVPVWLLDHAQRIELYMRLNPPGRRQTKKYRATVPLVPMLERHLAGIAEPFFVHWQGRQVASIKTTWRKVVRAAGLPAFPPKVLRHTVATELRRRGVPAWEVSGLLGHRTAGTTEIYAKFDPDYLGRAREALEAFLGDLARDVPWLGASAGPVVATGLPSVPPEIRAVAGFQVVGGTGFEPVTPTMSRSSNPRRIKD